ncbi:hypothetical protein [Nocardia mangyaensis]|uniref:hypothetical protein n=1 Tax=Nocardia mangyaensis TaxID=2213200 RepID=UPI00267702D6|nr:hypothetical protein [Nocardia mangyaensis]MDO3647678.1 hypothetical protein [Nocardia mangyaensis]
MSYDEQSLDAATWRHLEKRCHECTHAEIAYVIAELNRQVTEEGLRAAVLQSRIDRCDAMIADCVLQLERWANGGAV